MNMRFPELIECRNTTYPQMLRHEQHRFKWLAKHAYDGAIQFGSKCREIEAEMKRWGVEIERS